MASYKDPGFQDRINLAAEARERALEKLRNKAPVDEAVIAARKAAADAKQAAAAKKREARTQALAEQAAAKAAAKAVSKPAPPTPEQQKAARDARYAARKAGR